MNGFSCLLEKHFQLLYSASMGRFLQSALLLIIAIALTGCGAASESAFPQEIGFAEDSAMAMPAMAPAAGAPEMLREIAVQKEALEESETAAATTTQDGSFSTGDSLPSLDEVQSSVASQNRIIVRTVGMGLVVASVAESVDRIGDLAQELGGWTVSSDRSAIHHGFVSVRVPAQNLDGAVRRIRDLGIRTEYESSTSQDVTDEYVDITSRLRSLRATEEALLALLAQATDVEDALEVQRELTDLQAEIESLQGRIKFLEQTAAFSLISVDLTLAPTNMPVNAGPDQTFSAGQPARFRATFSPPEGIDEFYFVWDFGDGSTAEGTGSAPTTQPGQRVTATVTHVYEDDRDSPYIVELEMTGTGQAGIVEGTDTLIATVTRIPTIEVFAGERRVVEEGEEVEYSGSFTRPEGLWDIQYRWDFSDGSPTVTGLPEDDATRATAVHTFENYRPQPYQVTLTVTAQSEAGEVTGSDSFAVSVNESQGLIIGNWDLAESARWAIRSLSVVALAAINVLIWAAIFSPVWLGLAAVGYGLYRLNRYRRTRFPRRRSMAGGEIPGTAPNPGASSNEEPAPPA